MPNTYDLNDRFAIVTGAAKGIGRAVAETLQLRGARALIRDRIATNLPGVLSAAVDITRSDQRLLR